MTKQQPAICWYCSKKVTKYSYSHIEEGYLTGLAHIICDRCKRGKKIVMAQEKDV